ncbi:MAG: porin, partial [Candidatus Accumulibacter sp.]|nr:porin [Accumulibacter sp.]
MQKKIIALAVAGLVSGAAFAQTNVTLYGRIDQGYLYVNGKGLDASGNIVKTKYSGIQDGGDVGVGGSRVGVRGEENLGNGLKAVFTWEWNLQADRGTQSGNARQAFVGLSGGFGVVTLGRQDSPTRMWAGGSAPFGVAGVTPSNNLLNNNTSTATGFAVIDGGGAHSRWSDSIKWVSPVWSGVQVVAHYGFAGDVEKSAGKATTDSSRF